MAKAKKKSRTKTRSTPSPSATDKALRQVAVEQRRLQQQQTTLISRSIREQRRAGGALIRTATKAKKRVWRLLCEGDSWIRYDCGFGLFHYVEWLLGTRAACVNIGGSGATMAEMMKLPKRKELDTELRRGINGKPWDVLLFSGGGNDFADHFATWLLPYSGQTDPADAIAQPRFAALLNELATLYGKLAALVHNLSPRTLIFVNGYDFAIPNGTKVPFAGPWLKPAFDDRGYYPVDLKFRTEVVSIMLRQFAGMVQSVSVVYPSLRLVSTQGTLTPSQWDNELHPSNSGFRKVANVFIARLEADVPS
jgi:hypothetical protein